MGDLQVQYSGFNRYESLPNGFGDPLQSNLYNGRGEREWRRMDHESRHFGYDEGGQLLFEGENDGGSLQVRQLIVWLDGQPVALRQGNIRRGDPYAGEWLHVHADHLGSPRAITRPEANNAVVWRWRLEGSAFGQHAAEADPDGDGVALEFNLRYPGQYYDSATGWHYNYFRDYEPGTGRYIQSDPIGLEGGISSFAYVGSSPLFWIDPLGLRQICKTFRVDRVDLTTGVPVAYRGFQRECWEEPDPQPDKECPVEEPCGRWRCWNKCVETLTPTTNMPPVAGTLVGATSAASGWGVGSVIGCFAACNGDLDYLNRLRYAEMGLSYSWGPCAYR